MDVLRRFQGDLATKEAFKSFVMEVINEEALLKMYDRQDVSHIADARELITRAFEVLDETYGPTIKQSTDTINQSK